MSTVRKHIIWEEREHLQVALRTMELMRRGQEKREAMLNAQLECLPKDRRRKCDNAWLGPKFASFLDTLQCMLPVDLRALVAEHDLVSLDTVAEKATAQANLDTAPPAAEPAPAPVVETPPVAAAPAPEPEPEPTPAPAPTPIISPIVPALPISALGRVEQNLLAAVQDYVTVLVKPMLDTVIDKLHNEYVVPKLQEKLTSAVDGAIQGAIAANTQKIRDHVQSQVSQVVPEVASASEPPQTSTLLQTPAPLAEPKPLRLNNYWDAETDNIVVLGIWPANRESIKLAMRDKPWFQNVRIHYVQELRELEQKRNANTHLIQLEKFSAHLPKNYRSQVKRIYPNVKGVARLREIIEAIVLGNRSVDSY